MEEVGNQVEAGSNSGEGNRNDLRCRVWNSRDKLKQLKLFNV